MVTESHVREVVAKALAKLPPEAHMPFLDHTCVVADWLTQHGYHGWRSDSSECPIARFLCAETGLDIVVNDNEWCYYEHTWDHITLEVIGPLPMQVRHFITHFDEGAFPTLVDPGL